MSVIEKVKQEFEHFDHLTAAHLLEPAAAGVRKFVRNHHHELREIVERVGDGEISWMDVERKLTENVLGAIAQTVEELASDDD